MKNDNKFDVLTNPADQFFSVNVVEEPIKNSSETVVGASPKSTSEASKITQVNDSEVGIRGHKILTQRIGFLTDIATKEALSDLARSNKKTVNALLNEIVSEYLNANREN